MADGWLAIDFMTPTFSVHAFAETREILDKTDTCRLLLGDPKLWGDSFRRATRHFIPKQAQAGGFRASQPIGSPNVARFAMHSPHRRNR